MRAQMRLLGWRLATRHRVRTALLVLAVALPVLICACLSSLAATAAVSEDEARALMVGQSEGRLTALSRSADPRQALLPGTHLVPDVSYQDMPITSPGGRRTDVKGRALDLTDPATAGMFVVEEGRPGADPATIGLSRALAARLHVGVGDHVGVGPQGVPRRVSALLVYAPTADDVFFVSASPIPLAGPRAKDIEGSHRWLVVGGVDSGRLEAARLRYEPRQTFDGHVSGTQELQALSLGVGVGLLVECLLLVGAAMNMVVRAETRSAGLLAAMGAGPRIRWSFLQWYVRVVTVTGILVGSGLGLGLAYVVQGPVQERAAADWGRFTPAWWVLVAVAVIAWIGVSATCAAPRRRMRRAPLLHLLGQAPPTVREGSRGGWVVVVALLVLGLLVGAASVVWSYWSPLLALVAAPLICAGLVLACLRLVARRGASPTLPGPAGAGVAFRHLAAAPARAALTAMAIALVVCIATYLQMASQAFVESAERNPVTPVVPGYALVETRRPLTAGEVRDLGGTVRSITPVSSAAQGEGEVTLDTDLMRCLSATVVFSTSGAGGFDAVPCVSRSTAKVVFPSVAVATSDDAAAFARRPWLPGEAAAYAEGRLAVVTDDPGVPGPLTLAAQSFTAGGSHLQLHPLGRVPRRVAPGGARFGRMPVAYLSSAGARRLGLSPGDPQYLVAAAGPRQIQSRLPADVQADARITVNEESPQLGPARAMKVMATVGACLTAAAILAAMMALWSDDLRSSRQMMAALGASRRWLGSTGALLGGSIALVATALGALCGVAGGVTLARAARLPIPATWTPLLTVSVSVAVAVLVGALSVPRRWQVVRRG
ncbi:FtsX-like permease family protein [Arsenicicoccus dermatophilus]|uniref:FtsX-like permease family protein n=1 Tax=Arsenicicoccus dermatophilus TaxID=1076331 RepID=UPI003916E3BD